MARRKETIQSAVRTSTRIMRLKIDMHIELEEPVFGIPKKLDEVSFSSGVAKAIREHMPEFVFRVVPQQATKSVACIFPKEDR